jgi:adenylate cyclase
VSETRKIAAILVAGFVGYSRLAGAVGDGTLARLRSLRSDLIDPAIAAHHGRVVKRTGDGFLAEIRCVVEAKLIKTLSSVPDQAEACRKAGVPEQ